MTLRLSIIALAALTLAVGCSSSSTDPGTDGGAGTDGGSTAHDGGSTDVDLGGIITFDAGPDLGPVDSGPRADGAPVDGGPMPTIMGSVGSACSSAADCSMLTMPMCEMTVGMGGFMFTFPGGYCTQACGGMTGGMCPTGSTCVMFINFCAKTCTTDDDCRASEGYTCTAPPFGGGANYCAPPMGMMPPRGDGGGFPMP